MILFQKSGDRKSGNRTRRRTAFNVVLGFTGSSLAKNAFFSADMVDNAVTVKQMVNKANSPLVSVIILNYNGLMFVDRCLQSVLNSDYPNFEVIFVDNASIDKSVEFVRKKFGANPKLKILRNRINLGFAEGNNSGARFAKGEFIVFLNIDTYVTPSWLKELVDVMVKDPKIGACQGKIMLMSDTEKFDCIGGYIDYYGFPHGKADLQEDGGQYEKMEEIFHAKGAALFVRREVLDKIGCFDPEFFILYEEIDFCWRIRLAGYKVVYVPTSKIFHEVHGIAKETPSSLKVFHATKNHMLMLLKNYSFVNLLKNLPHVILFRLGEILFLLAKHKYTLACSKINAQLWVLANLRYAFRERLKVQAIRRASDNDIMRHMKKPDLILLYKHFARLYFT